jgi:RNA polymerase sigma-70 factor (ECF subfamily)
LGNKRGLPRYKCCRKADSMAAGVAVATWEKAGRRLVGESEEAHLIARCRAGDRQAQETLVHRCQKMVYRVACSMLSDPEEALDASQDVLVAMLRSLPRFRGESRFQTWLYRITVNVCIMRRRSLRARTRLVTSFPSEPPQRPWHEDDPGSAVVSREAQAAVREHLRRLPPEYRAVLVLRELEGLSYGEIAEALGIPLGTVQSRIGRGRRRLRDLLLADERIRVPRPGGEKR